MAIEVIVGNVGSGKTYYATYRIWQEVKKMYEAEIKGLDYKYKVIYTNIEGIQPNKYVKHLKVQGLLDVYEQELKVYKEFEKQHTTSRLTEDLKNNVAQEEEVKEDELETHYINYTDNIREWKSKVEKMLHDISIIKEDVEHEFIKITKPIFQKNNFTDALFVIDEAHNFFRFLSPPALRLVSYHRHYDQDYILITQDLKQLDRRLLGLTEKTIKAVNPTLKTSKNFKYKVYSGGYISYRDTNLIDKIVLKADPDIFNLYNSGGTKPSKSYLIKVLYKPILLILFVVIGYVYFIEYFPKTFQKAHHSSHSNIATHIKTENPQKWETIEALIAGNFVLYNGKKYNLDNFNYALMSCKARLNKIRKNLDSSTTYFYKIKDKTCLNKYL